MIFMRWHTETDETTPSPKPRHGYVYFCNHEVYNRCTLYRMGSLGLAVIQQRCRNKLTYWTDIDPWLVDYIYKHPKFYDYFKKRAGKEVNGCYPTVTVRQIMWALRIKPLPKQKWETVFDRKEI